MKNLLVTIISVLFSVLLVSNANGQLTTDEYLDILGHIECPDDINPKVAPPTVGTSFTTTAVASRSLFIVAPPVEAWISYSKSMLFVDFLTDLGEINVRVTDELGKEYHNSQVNSTTVKYKNIDIAALNPGTYFLSVSNSTGTVYTSFEIDINLIFLNAIK